MNNTSLKRSFVWIPRSIAILFAAFISVFAFDAFGEKHSSLAEMAGFLIHLVPALVVVVSLIIAWRFRLVGGLLFVIVGIASALFFKTYSSIGTFCMLSVPLFLIGAMFVASYSLKRSDIA